jgi:hypothetical protein
MAQLKLGAAGVTANEIDISGPVSFQPSGIPAGVIGTAKQGPAFVPITIGRLSDFEAKFGSVDSKHFGPMAVLEWLRNSQAATFLRVLGVGDGLARQDAGGAYPGSVTNAGFVVGENQPSGTIGILAANQYANLGGAPGRTYFLGCYMSESAGSTFFSDAGIQSDPRAVPILRGVVMTPSGVLMTLSSSLPGCPSDAPASTQIGSLSAVPGVSGSTFGTVVLTDNNVSKQEFIVLLNGHKGTDPDNPNVLTASFDMTSNAYFANTLNKNPFKFQEKGHFLYAHWDIHPSLASVTGSGILSASHGASAGGSFYGGRPGVESSAFLLTSSLDRNSGSTTVPNFETFADRFAYSKSPWVISQKFGGKPQNLFRLHSLDAGQDISSLYKISIENITPSSDPANKYGSFTLKVRKWDDTESDIDQKLITTGESFVVDLNPTSNRYIAKVIGDLNTYFDFDRDVEEQKLVTEGSYPNRSNFIRVEVHPDVENGFVDPSALPMGFRGVSHLVTSGSVFPAVPGGLSDFLGGGIDTPALNVMQQVKTPPLPMRKKITQGAFNSDTERLEGSFYWGVHFEHPAAANKLNGSFEKNNSLKNSFAKYFPDFATVDMPFVVGDNTGAPDTAANGVLDADRFCNNLFSLEHIRVVTGSGPSALAAATQDAWIQAQYVRNGVVNTSGNTRAFAVKDLRETNNRLYAKFSFFLQGGFNGVNIFDEDEFNLTNNAVSSDMNSSTNRGLNDGPNVKVYQKAIDIMRNTTNLDIQLLAVPGLRHPIITDYATVATEERFDALYLMDVEQFTEDGIETENEIRNNKQITSINNTVSVFRDRNIDSSFAAAYFPDVLYSAPDGNNVFVPPSVLVLGALSLNDAVGHPWFAPAGFTRGALPEAALEARTKLREEDLDLLYNERLNPLVAFVNAPKSGTNPASGLVVWGQKTLQLAASALDRVNVRRLLIEIRRQVRDIAQTIIFEPNREATLARFSAAVTPRLQRIQALAGLERFRVIIDSSTTTQVDIENNTVRGKIFVQPTKSIEFVSLDFVVANNLTQVQ